MAGLGSSSGLDPLKSELEAAFPGLRSSPYELTSPADEAYNCLAWAAQVTNLRWWPSPDGYWPRSAPREPTVEGACAAYATQGYTTTTTERLEKGWEKVAVFVGADGRLTHAARQLDDGTWTSKLGESVDLSHALRALEGETYGRVALVLGRPSRKREGGWWSRFLRRRRGCRGVSPASRP
jgi:hypothetical protein